MLIHNRILVAFILLLPTIRIGKEDNKVTNLVHLYVSHLACSCTPEENGVIQIMFLLQIAIC